MRVLLTGANGFVGSHILDELCHRGIETSILLRSTSSTAFINHRLNQIKVCRGSLDNPDSLKSALGDVTHVIHCAGLVRALEPSDFYRANQQGTRNLVEAINESGKNRVKRLVLISSLAATGPSAPGKLRREEDAPCPITDYGRSKLAAEEEVIQNCEVEYTILRPPGIYGDRDGEFLRLFKAVRNHILPLFGGGKQQLSIVYVKDLAHVCVEALLEPEAAGRIYFVANPQITTSGELAKTIADELNVWTFPLYLQLQALYAICLCQEMISRLSKKPSVLSRQKYRELSAAAWTCDVSKLKNELGIVCQTSLKEGVKKTLEWYRSEGWLR
jgi:nucleoside-diphosphate-sugar epimerase